MSFESRRRWPWMVAAVLALVAGLWAISTFTFLMWFTLGMRAFEGDEPGTGHWVVLATVDLAALALLAWGTTQLWSRGAGSST